MEKQINQKIVEIAQFANSTIPVEWGELYVVVEMDKSYSGGVYFYFGFNNKFYYQLEMPEDFGIPMSEVIAENRELYKKSEDLKRLFLENDLADWYICIIHVNENNKLSVDFDYAPWLESDFGPTARINYFRYKNLGFEPRNKKEAEQFKAMEAFQAEHNSK